MHWKKFLAWQYPKENGLEQLIQQKELYPIRTLRLKASELDAFSENNIVFARDLVEVELNQISGKTHIPFKRLQRLQNLVNEIISQ